MPAWLSSRRAVHGILNSQTVKPHKVRYYLERRDPEFDKRKAEVLEVYAAAEMLRALPEAELLSPFGAR
jgi:hypothetical protein